MAFQSCFSSYIQIFDRMSHSVCDINSLWCLDMYEKDAHSCVFFWLAGWQSKYNGLKSFLKKYSYFHAQYILTFNNEQIRNVSSTNAAKKVLLLRSSRIDWNFLDLFWIICLCQGPWSLWVGPWILWVGPWGPPGPRVLQVPRGPQGPQF